MAGGHFVCAIRYTFRGTSVDKDGQTTTDVVDIMSGVDDVDVDE